MKRISFFLTFFSCFLLQATMPEEHGLRALSDAFTVEPTTLLTPTRFDISSKYIYAHHLIKRVQCSWAEQLYYDHIHAINNFYESSPIKKGKADFITSFHATLFSIQKNGFSESFIPVDENLNPRDGSHRAASCITLREKPICKIYNYEPAKSYITANYLQNRGMQKKYLDASALAYATLKKNCYIALVMPAAVDKNNEIETVLNQHCTIVYKKNILLNKNGAFNLTKQLYKNEPWLGSWNNNFSGVWNKALCCFPQDHRKNNPIRVFLIEADNIELVKTCKQKIRNLFNLENHSIHINDTHEQTVVIAQSLFVENSIHFMNYSQQKNFSRFRPILHLYKTWLQKQNLPVENFCIDSGAILSAYGLRDCGDLDYLHHGYDHIKPPHCLIESHNNSMGNHKKTKDEIIFNPENHFWYNGVKFAALHIIKDLKQNGGGIQNKNDVEMIKTILNQ